MKNILIIIGASGHGKVVADIAIKVNRWQNVVFLDDDESIKISMGLKVIGKTADAYKYKDDADFFVAIGNNTIREKVLNKLLEIDLSVISLMHPSAVIGTEVEIDIGTVVMAGAIINSSTRIAKGCIINTNATIEHDNVLEDYVHISPGACLAGTVKVGRRSQLGIGSIISNNVSICNDCILGAGAVVVRDITESGTYVGVPVRKYISV